MEIRIEDVLEAIKDYRSKAVLTDSNRKGGYYGER